MARRALQVDPNKATTNKLDVTAGGVDHAAIAARAYELWEMRGRPIGSDEEDWIRAEQELTGS
jgi:hypothetical protein